MRIREHGWLVGLVALALAGTVACQRQPDAPPASGPAAQTTEDRDTRITTSVQARFYSDEAVRGRHIQVHTEDGVVMLRGSVDTEQARQRAVELARDVAGVERVEDNLHVGAPVATTGTDPMAPMAPRTDPTIDRPADETPGRPHTDMAGRRDDDGVNASWVTTKIQAQYFVTPGVAPWNVDVTTSAAGVVTLEGEVDSEENRQRAVQIARDTEGVTRVEDRLRVRADGDDAARTAGAGEADRTEGWDRPDAWITTKVQSKYFLDDDVRGRRIDVTTGDGIVTLRGAVQSEQERRQAVALARNTDGVRDVRDELTIEPADRTDRESPATGPTAGDRPDADRDPADGRTVGDRVDDGWITIKIQSQLYLEQNVRGRNVEVETRDGVVTLRGHVASDAERRLAEQIARDTDGVRRVDNQIAIGQAAAPGDDR
jgi:hyperosmotically inducible periplasmic protein